ncbi:MAG: zf-HC2 domain-containing protein [Acidobacteriia bacterium]|nr:zf-HC2 domain-containing protein [Terriglobia bacterium]
MKFDTGLTAVGGDGNPGEHFPEAQIENYSRGMLTDAEAAQLEEHLIQCETCRDKLDESDYYVRSIRLAAKQLRAEPEPARGLWRFPRLVPLLAAAVICVVVAPRVLRMGHQGGFEPPVAVSLEATRGAVSVAHGPASKTLELRPGLEGLPVLAAYDLVVVDASGKQVSKSHFVPNSGAPSLALPAGSYFVRLYDPAGALLREYGLEVRP